MSFVDQPAARESSIPNINDRYLADEQELVRQLAKEADPGESGREKIQSTAAQLVRAVRKNTKKDGGIEAFLQQYDLSSDEGVLLMCIAEALLRIPDADTADRLPAEMRTVITHTFEELEAQHVPLQTTLAESRATMAELNGAMQNADELVTSLDRTLERVTEAGQAWEAVGVAFMGDDEEESEPAEPKKTALQQALTNLCQVLLSSNEFLYVE